MQVSKAGAANTGLVVGITTSAVIISRVSPVLAEIVSEKSALLGRFGHETLTMIFVALLTFVLATIREFPFPFGKK